MQPDDAWTLRVPVTDCPEAGMAGLKVSESKTIDPAAWAGVAIAAAGTLVPNKSAAAIASFLAAFTTLSLPTFHDKPGTFG
jgi:hypothetical protein